MENVTRKYTHSEQNTAAKAIAKALRKNGVKCRVLRGNGSTSPNGSDKDGNYFVIEPDTRRGRLFDDARESLYLNFDIDNSNANAIKKALDNEGIKYEWAGDLYSCFEFKTSHFIKP